MPERLTERFAIGALVEIDLGDRGWQPGLVVQHDHPGLWVRTEDGRFWFVTNGRKIRKRSESDSGREIHE